MLRICWLLMLMGGLLFTGCRLIRENTASARPHWITEPKTSDSIYLYAIGFSAGQPSPELARDAAFQDAVERMAVQIWAAEVPGVPFPGAQAVGLRGVERLQGAEYAETDVAGTRCWIQVSCPVSEKVRVADWHEKVKPLLVLQDAAYTHFAAGRFTEARAALTELMGALNVTTAPAFNPDALHSLMAQVALEQKDFLEARRSLELIVAASSDAVQRSKAVERLAGLPPPPAFWPMHDRLGGGKVGLISAWREAGRVEPYPALLAGLSKACREVLLDRVDLMAAAGEAGITRLFDTLILEGVAAVAASNGCTSVLAVLVDVDDERRKQNRAAPRDRWVIDTTVRFMVIRVRDAVSVYDGSFRETVGNHAETGMAGRMLGLLLHRYLLVHCPALDAPPDGVHKRD